MKRYAYLAAALLILGGLLAGCDAQPPEQSDGSGTVTFSMVNIGKGDCLLVTAGTHAYLIDTGRAEDYPVIMQALRAKDVTRLDGIFLTHGHSDHAGCLEALSCVFSAKTIYYSALDTQTVDKAKLCAIGQASGAKLVSLKTSDAVEMAPGQPALTMTVLGPTGVDLQEKNNNSLVMRMAYGDTAFLLMGDALAAEESQLIDSEADLSADVLKVGHHGKDDASTQRFLSLVGARYACITGSLLEDDDSADAAVISRLQALGMEVTVSQGDFLTMDYSSDGRQVTARSSSAPAYAPAQRVVLRSVERKAERVVVANESASPVDVSRWVLWSQQGNQVFMFPDGTTLAPGETLSVVSGKNPPEGDFVWNADAIWKKDGDTALLYDANGVLVDSDG